jgi:NADPH-dependent 2,4-dienoyl-CoA reductase/sulfur reductase-like enzyme
MEDEYDLTPDEVSKKVLVVGGGVAGCEAAISAGMKGHQVTLIEKSDRLGGQWIPASVPIGKGEFTGLLYWQSRQLKKYGVDVRLNQEADLAFIREFAPDVLIMATGSLPFVPGIPGKDQDFVVNAHQVLLGKADCGHKIVVIGGGLVGCETADMLAEQGADVAIIEMMPEIMRDGEATPTMYLKQRFEEYGVKILTSTKLMEIGDRCVVAERDGSDIRIEDVDTVVVAVGVKTDTSLLNEVEGLGCRVIKVGDANGVKNGYKGIREGFEAGLRIGGK